MCLGHERAHCSFKATPEPVSSNSGVQMTPPIREATACTRSPGLPGLSTQKTEAPTRSCTTVSSDVRRQSAHCPADCFQKICYARVHKDPSTPASPASPGATSSGAERSPSGPVVPRVSASLAGSRSSSRQPLAPTCVGRQPLVGQQNNGYLSEPSSGSTLLHHAGLHPQQNWPLP